MAHYYGKKTSGTAEAAKGGKGSGAEKGESEKHDSKGGKDVHKAGEKGGEKKAQEKKGVVGSITDRLPLGGKKGGKAGKGKDAKGAGKGRGEVAKISPEAAKKIVEEMKSRKVTKDDQISAYGVIQHPLITEKSVNMIEAENKLVFIVSRAATKGEVKKAVEALYGIKVDAVNVLNDTKARKRAIVKINRAFKAGDVATKLGIL
ncbi:MAG: 50S ribosomal protein L23 [Candidatus Diapherotrites archaeon]